PCRSSRRAHPEKPVRIRRSHAALAAAAATGIIIAACTDSPTAPKNAPPSLDPVVVTAASLLGSTGTIIDHAAPSKCITAGGSATTTAAVQLAACSTAAAQQFTWQTNATISVFAGKMCVTDQGAKGANYDLIITYPCHNTTNQHWTRNSSGEIVGINSKCLTINGSRLMLYTCNAGASQIWDVTAAGTTTTTTSGLTIAISSGNNQVATYGAAVASPLVVVVHKSGGAVAPTSSITNASGLAHIGFKVSSTFFTSKATATAGGASVTFTANGNGTPDLQGRKIFPSTSPWNTDISTATVDPNSAALIASCGSGNQLHPDFGTV